MKRTGFARRLSLVSLGTVNASVFSNRLARTEHRTPLSWK
jgi:hypothetical protein